MIFEVNREEFARAIIPAVEVATKGVLKDFKFENLLTIKAEQDQVVLLSYGGTLSLIAPLSDSNFADLEYKCDNEGSATVYADDLAMFMRSVPKSYKTIKISLSQNQLKIANADPKGKKDKTERAMSTLSEVVRPPNLGDTFDQDINIDREIFVNGLNSVLFAPAYEEKLYSYKCMLFEAEMDKDQEVRFSAGTGGRFAIKSVKGKNIVTNQSQAKMIFPNSSLSSISKILGGAAQAEISIKSVGVDQAKHIPEHIMIEFDEMILCVYGLEHFTKYPDLTKVLKHQYSNRVYSSLEDWKYASGAIEGTRNRWSDSIHNTEVLVEEDEEVFKVTPQTPNTNPTFIGMTDVDDCVVKGDKIWFRCNSRYLTEMVSQGGGKGRVQLNFESQSILDGVTDDKKAQKLMKPVLIKFPENVDDAKNTVDNFYMFFSISTK
jgi:DNA polymerase III sliding clamp (beta) subunit (PCNA family)